MTTLSKDDVRVLEIARQRLYQLTDSLNSLNRDAIPPIPPLPPRHPPLLPASAPLHARRPPRRRRRLPATRLPGPRAGSHAGADAAQEARDGRGGVGG
ncbi:MAG: hypothetical protein Q9207_003697 [Kuettlingeria erythrocarpa]